MDIIPLGRNPSYCQAVSFQFLLQTGLLNKFIIEFSCRYSGFFFFFHLNVWFFFYFIFFQCQGLTVLSIFQDDMGLRLTDNNWVNHAGNMNGGTLVSVFCVCVFFPFSSWRLIVGIKHSMVIWVNRLFPTFFWLRWSISSFALLSTHKLSNVEMDVHHLH